MKKKNNLQVTMGIALALILFGLVNLGVYTFYPSQEYSNYCEKINKPVQLENPRNNSLENESICYENYNNAKENYDNQIFYIYLLLGLVLTIGGLFIIYLPFQIVGIGTGTILIIEGIIKNLEKRIPAFIAGVIVFGILAYFVWKKVR